MARIINQPLTEPVLTTEWARGQWLKYIKFGLGQWLEQAKRRAQSVVEKSGSVSS
jgi:hypothetical protein